MSIAQTSEPITSTTITVFHDILMNAHDVTTPNGSAVNVASLGTSVKAGKPQYLSAKNTVFGASGAGRTDPAWKARPCEDRIAEAEAAKEAAKAATAKPLEVALKQWLSGMKSPGEMSLNTYRSTTRKILRWAASVNVVSFGDATPSLLHLEAFSSQTLGKSTAYFAKGAK